MVDRLLGRLLGCLQLEAELPVNVRQLYHPSPELTENPHVGGTNVGKIRSAAPLIHLAVAMCGQRHHQTLDVGFKETVVFYINHS